MTHRIVKHEREILFIKTIAYITDKTQHTRKGEAYRNTILYFLMFDSRTNKPNTFAFEQVKHLLIWYCFLRIVS